MEPVEFGWTNTAGYEDYGNRDMALRPDAGRYECGTLNTIGCYGLRASIEFLLEVGIEKIAPVVQALGDRIAQGARQRGYEVLGERTPENGAGIVSFRKPGMRFQRDRRPSAREQNYHRCPRRLGAGVASLLHFDGRNRHDARPSSMMVVNVDRRPVIWQASRDA